MDVLTMLKQDEGLRLKIYYDTKGNPSIGYGWNINTFDMTDAEYFLNKKVSQVTKFLQTYLWFNSIDDTRKSALINMAYNTGEEGFSKFDTMISFLAVKKYEEAANDLAKTEVAEELVNRYKRIENMLRTGNWS